VTYGDAARDALARQIDSPVRWVESIEWMVAEGGVEAFVEVGPGSVLLNTIKRIRPDVERIALGGPDDLSNLNH
jgi:[acyl-carrier-protein] S-malonyltransferase